MYDPYGMGYTRATLIKNSGELFRNIEQKLKANLGADCFLKLRNMRVESLVIVDEDAAVNIQPDLCTHRPSRHGNW